jgi:pimeloyl-ACP methyl ester carboxylesterase
MKKRIANTIKYLFLAIVIWTTLAQCFISKNRWTDNKAESIFKTRNVPLALHDSLINNRHIHYAITGIDTLPTLVFIHGSPGSWMNYHKFMSDPDLLNKFRLVSIDRPGFGLSNFGEAMHLKAQCELLLPVLKSLKNNKPIYLCGHSMGGPVVVQLAAMDTSLFKKIIIVAGALDAAQEKTETWRKIMEVKPFYWLLPGSFAPSNTELLYLKKDLIQLQAEFKKITCDVLFIHGSKDTWVPIQNIDYGIKMLTNARSLEADTLFGADHQIPWKNSNQLKEILMQIDKN